MTAQIRRRAPRARERAGAIRRFAGALACVLLHALLSSPGFALDGRVEVRNTVQGGQAGADAYHQNNLQSDAIAGQFVPFGRIALLRLNGRYLREQFNSRIGSLESDFARRTGQGDVSFDLRGRRARLSLYGNGLDQRSSGEETGSPRLLRRQIGTSADLNRRLARLNASCILTTSRRSNPSGPDSRDQELSGSAGARTSLPKLGELGYRFSALVSRNLTRNFRSDQTSHIATFASSTRFAGGRGLAAMKANTHILDLEDRRQVAPAGERLHLPFVGGYRLDDTPELADPLEVDLTPVPALFDGNRNATTEVNLGDSAPPVREFGGDFRNIQYDFGEAADLSSAILYVDQTLLTPGLFRWRIFVSNDPEGRIFEELQASAFDIAYKEWGTGLQGWAVTLSNPVSARFFKMVDVKLGPTLPDLFVTELEVSTHEVEVSTADRSKTSSHRLTASLGYNLSSSIHTGYDLSYRRRTISGQTGALEERGHGFSAGWNKGLWSASGRADTRTLKGRRAGDTITDTQNLSVRRGRSDALRLDLSWSRARDSGPELRKISNGLSLGLTWPAAPALRIQHRVSVGWLDDQGRDRSSTSVATTTSASGQPISTMTVDLQYSDRWVSQEAGTGFSRFNDTSLTVGWRPLPLVSYQSQVRYQARDRGEWITRNTVSWEPFSNGNLKSRFNATHYRDTRAQETQRSGGIEVEWAARPNLTFVAGAESAVFTTASQKNSPFNTALRGTWRF